MKQAQAQEQDMTYQEAKAELVSIFGEKAVSHVGYRLIVRLGDGPTLIQALDQGWRDFVNEASVIHHRLNGDMIYAGLAPSAIPSIPAGGRSNGSEIFIPSPRRKSVPHAQIMTDIRALFLAAFGIEYFQSSCVEDDGGRFYYAVRDCIEVDRDGDLDASYSVLLFVAINPSGRAKISSGDKSVVRDSVDHALDAWCALHDGPGEDSRKYVFSVFDNARKKVQ